MKSLDAKLADKIIRRDVGCWDWVGSLNIHGYGKVRPQSIEITCDLGFPHLIRQGQKQAHRVVYESLVGPIPEGLVLDHLCSNRACVRPDHLEPVTHQENVRRVFEGKTHCINNHELTEENTYVWRNRKACRICRTAAAYRHKGLG